MDILIQAGRLKHELRKLPDVTVKSTWGARGQLDIFRDGQKIFSHQESGTMPSVAELVKRVTS